MMHPRGHEGMENKGVGVNRFPAGTYRSDPQARILAGVEYDTVGGCRLWSEALDRSGYGRVSDNKNRKLAHRAAYEAFVGDPSGFIVMHRCDVPSCVNPAHMFLGSHTENMRDAARKGRLRPPTPYRRTSKETARLIVDFEKNNSVRATARHFGVDPVTVRRLRALATDASASETPAPSPSPIPAGLKPPIRTSKGPPRLVFRAGLKPPIPPFF